MPFSLKNCCFPAFLANEYQRHCRSAFEELNRVMKPIVPKTQEPFAMGVGTSIAGSDGKFYKKIQFRVDGVDVTVDRYE